MSILTDKFQNKILGTEKRESNLDWYKTPQANNMLQPTNISQANNQNAHSNSTEQQMQNVGQSFLQEGCAIRGAFECVGDFRLDGFIEGDLVVDGTITVGESAMIRANVRARSAIVFGRIVGDIICADRIELHVGAQVRGNIKTRKLVIQDGVIFDGRCEMAYEKSDAAQDSEKTNNSTK